jgi:hypothetical protein
MVAVITLLLSPASTRKAAFLLLVAHVKVLTALVEINRMLLWKGIRSTSVPSILAQGFRVPPAEAPSLMHMFGKMTLPGLSTLYPLPSTFPYPRLASSLSLRSL